MAEIGHGLTLGIGFAIGVALIEAVRSFGRWVFMVVSDDKHVDI